MRKYRFLTPGTDESDIQLKLRFVLRFLLKVLDLLLVKPRKIVQRLYAESPKELLRRPKQERTPRRIQPPRLFHQAILNKLVHCVV